MPSERVAGPWPTAPGSPRRQSALTPAAVAENNQPVFDETGIVQIEQLRTLFEIGYDTVQLKKIARKVGWPHPVEGDRRPRVVQRYLTVGELAARSGLNPRTIKYWEERGILEPTMRSDGGFRLYAEHNCLFCNLIHDLQLFGYSLEDIKTIADLFRVFDELNKQTFKGTKEDAFDRLQEMLQKIQALSAKMDELDQGIERWRKLLKEKRAEVQSLGRQHRPAKSKAPKPVTAASESSS